MRSKKLITKSRNYDRMTKFEDAKFKELSSTREEEELVKIYYSVSTCEMRQWHYENVLRVERERDVCDCPASSYMGHICYSCIHICDCCGNAFFKIEYIDGVRCRIRSLTDISSSKIKEFNPESISHVQTLIRKRYLKQILRRIKRNTVLWNKYKNKEICSNNTTRISIHFPHNVLQNIAKYIEDTSSFALVCHSFLRVIVVEKSSLPWDMLTEIFARTDPTTLLNAVSLLSKECYQWVNDYSWKQAYLNLRGNNHEPYIDVYFDMTWKAMYIYSLRESKEYGYPELCDSRDNTYNSILEELRYYEKWADEHFI